jgi:predicted nucleotidyltransferase
MAREGDAMRPLVTALRKAVGALNDAGVPFLLGGGLACWARGAPESDHDVDLFLRPEHAERAAEVLAAAGMRIERPPEGWLFKAYDDDVYVDLIFEPSSGPVDDELFARADELVVRSVPMKVASVTDVLAAKLLALTEQDPDYGDVLQIARALREQIDWARLRAATDESPFARAFFTLAEGLHLVGDATSAR